MLTDPGETRMIFGLNRTTDEQSLRELLEHFAHHRVTDTLIPRMTDEEINLVVDLLMKVMRNHFSDQEYHALFLNEPDHHH